MDNNISEKFFNLMGDYHNATEPMPYISIMLALVIIWLLFSDIKSKNIIITTTVGFFWAWNGLVLFTMHSAYLAPLTYAIQGILFPLEAIFLFYLVRSSKNLEYKLSDTFTSKFGFFMMFFALFLYPVLGNILGHSYPNAPVFGEPCPLTIFTLGLFLTSIKKVDFKIYIIPFLWSLMGFVAVFKLKVMSDIFEIVFGIISFYLLLKGYNINLKKQTEKENIK